MNKLRQWAQVQQKSRGEKVASVLGLASAVLLLFQQLDMLGEERTDPASQVEHMTAPPALEVLAPHTCPLVELASTVEVQVRLTTPIA